MPRQTRPCVVDPVRRVAAAVALLAEDVPTGHGQSGRHTRTCPPPRPRPYGAAPTTTVAAMTLQVEDAARVRTLTLDRPEALNAFNEELYDATRRRAATRRPTTRPSRSCC